MGVRVGSLLVVVLAWGCGRVGYDDDPPLVIRAADEMITLSVPERFQIRLSRASRFQVESWIDFSQDPTAELAGRMDGPLHYNVLQAPYRVFYAGGELLLDDVDATNHHFLTIEETRVELETWYEWYTSEDDAIEVIAIHDIRNDGTWTVTASLVNKSGPVKTMGFQYAFTNVAAAMPWQETRRADGFDFIIANGSTLEVQRELGMEAALASDQPGNLYFGATAEVTLEPDGVVTQVWTNQLGRW